jgi:hypothetical protein
MATQPQAEPQAQPLNGAAIEAEPQRPQSEGRQFFEAVIDKTSAEMQRLKFEEERFSFQQRRAKLFASSGLFTVKERGQELPLDVAIAQAMVKIELGEAMGFSPAESLQGIHVINGQTAISSALRAARMQSAGYSWDLEWSGTEEDCTGVRVWLYYKGKPLTTRGGEQASVAFLKRDAEKMLTTITDWDGVPSGGKPNKRRVSILEKDNWKMSPRNMYFARAITNAQRFYAPAVLSVNLPSIEEAQEAEPAEPVARGSVTAAEDVAERKIEELERQRSEQGTASGETPAQRDARLERQMAEQLDKAKAAEAAKVDRKKYAKGDELPDAESVPEGTEVEYDGKILRSIGEPGEARSWKTVEEPVQQSPAAARQRPVFGRKP